MASVELDTVDFENKEFQTFLIENQIKTTVIKCVGPGGGWPIIQYTGTVNVLKEMIHFFWDDDDFWEFIDEADEL